MDFAQRTIDLAHQNVAEGGRPFVTVTVEDVEILVEAANRVAPTAHAETLAVSQACKKPGTEQLVGATVYLPADPVPDVPGLAVFLFAGRSRLLGFA